MLIEAVNECDVLCENQAYVTRYNLEKAAKNDAQGKKGVF